MSTVSRDLNNNFSIDNQPLSLDDFHKLGINEKFVQPGTSATLSQATLGHEGGNVAIVQQILDGMQSKGLTINPNVPITPQSVQEFMSFASQNVNNFLPYAQKEIAPYYQTQLKLASDQLGKSLGYSEEQLSQNEKDIQTKYTDTLKGIGVQAAEKGFAQSGERNLQEQQLATQTQNTIEQNRRQLSYNAGNEAANFAQKYGSGALSGLNTPQLGATPRVLPGQSQFDTSGPSSSLYTLSPNVYNGLTGSEQFAQTTAEN